MEKALEKKLDSILDRLLKLEKKIDQLSLSPGVRQETPEGYENDLSLEAASGLVKKHCLKQKSYPIQPCSVLNDSYQVTSKYMERRSSELLVYLNKNKDLKNKIRDIQCKKYKIAYGIESKKGPMEEMELIKELMEQIFTSYNLKRGEK